jgi:hypothetical protein
MSLWNFGKSSGTDRVPEHLKVKQAPPAYIHRTIDARVGLLDKPIKRAYVNPRRDAKSARSGRLRKELRGGES